METAKRKITAKVNREAIPSPSPTRPPSRISDPQLPNSTLSPPAAIRAKAKVSSSATVGSLKPVAPRSPGSVITNGRKTPASSVAGRPARERPTSIISTPTRQPATPFSQPASPMLPPSRRAKSPQALTGSRVTSPAPRPARVKSPTLRPEPRFMSPSPSNQRVLDPSSGLARRATSPSARPSRQFGSPIPVPPLTIPAQDASPTRTSTLNSTTSRGPSHRRVASASSALSTSSVAPRDLPRPTLRVPQSLSEIALDRPATFSAIPRTPPKSAQAELSSPPLSLINSKDQAPQDDTLTTESSESSEPSESFTPPSATPPVLVSTPNGIDVAPSAPATPGSVQTPASDSLVTRPRTPSISASPNMNGTAIQPQPNGTTASFANGVRITAKVSPATLASNFASIRPLARAPQLAAPDRDHSSSGSTVSAIAPSMISGVSSIRVSANSRILSPPPGRRTSFLGFNPSGSFPIPPPLHSPPASTISSMSSASHASRHSRSASYGFGTLADRARTPTDIGLRPRLSGGPLSLGITRPSLEDVSIERDDSGIDMLEADDEEHEHREEARSNRKIADLEISNKSLLTVNAMLESTKARQAKEIRELRRKLRESRLVLPPRTFAALEESDPLQEVEPAEAEADEDSDNDVTQDQADETFGRVRLLLDNLLADAKTALEAGPTRVSPKAGIGGPTIRVLNVHDVDESATGKSEDEEEDETDHSDATESVVGDLDSIDGVSPLLEKPPLPIPGPAPVPAKKAETGAFSGLRSSLNIRRWM